MPAANDSAQDQHILPAPSAQAALPAHAGDQAGKPAGAAAGNEPPAKGNRGGFWRRIGLLLIVLAGVAFAFWRIHGNNKEQAAADAKTAAAADRAIPVTVTPVVAKTMPIYLTALGTVTAYNTVTVKSRVDGQLLSVNVREGQQVRQGQVLAMIDPRPYQAAVAQAEGQLAKDQAAAANARAEAGRYTALFQAGVVSKESQQVQVSNAGQSAGTLEADRAAIQAAKVNVAYTRITSPINGVVGLRQVDAGNIVHASDANGLLVVTQLQPITVIFTLPEDQLPEVLKLIRGGRKLAVEAFDRSETTHLASGTLLTMDNTIDPTTGTVKAKAVFQNTDGALFPNQFVNIRLILEQRQNSLVVPAAALQNGVGGSFVYVVKPGAPPRAASSDDGNGGPGAAPSGKGKGAAGGSRPGSNSGSPAAGATDQSRGPQFYVDVQNVAVDLTEGSQLILKSGVNPGDQVVIDGQEKLKKYSKVQPQQGQSNAGGPGTRQIGSEGSGAAAPPQSGGPDQPNPEARPTQGRPTGMQNGQGQGTRQGGGSGAGPGAGGGRQ